MNKKSKSRLQANKNKPTNNKEQTKTTTDNKL